MPGCLSHPVEGPWDRAVGRVPHHRHSSAIPNWPHPTLPTTQMSWAPKEMQSLGLGFIYTFPGPLTPTIKSFRSSEIIDRHHNIWRRAEPQESESIEKIHFQLIPRASPDCSVPHIISPSSIDPHISSRDAALYLPSPRSQGRTRGGLCFASL